MQQSIIVRIEKKQSYYNLILDPKNFLKIPLNVSFRKIHFFLKKMFLGNMQEFNL